MTASVTGVDPFFPPHDLPATGVSLTTEHFAPMAAKNSASTPRKSAQAKSAAAPKQRTAATPRSARKASAGDELVTIDRRRASRRDEDQPESAPAPPLERRAKVQRRRQIDPTTCERDYSTEEVEFMNAMDEYKRKNGRMFPTCSEVLEVIRSLGYVQISAAGRAMLATDGDLNGDATPEEDFTAAAL